MSKKGRGRRKSTRPSRKSRPPVGAHASAAMDSLVQARMPSRLELVEEPSLELAESARLELVPDAADSSPAVSADEARSSGTVAVADPFRAEASGDGDPPVDPDEISIPPIGDVEAEQFFSEGDLGKHLASVEEEALDDELWTELHAREARRTRPEVVERRARNQRYVKWAVGVGAVVCLAALARAGVSRLSAGVDARTTLAATAAPVVASPKAAEPAPAVAIATAAAAPIVAPAPADNTKATVEPTTPAAADPTPPAASPAPTQEAVAVAKPEPTARAAAPAETPPVASTAAPDKPAAPTPSAAALKGRARASLEAGAAVQAVRLGEQSVAADPSDGEAWLILGAAYQERGNLAQARRCYSACLQKGKRGPLGECRAMLR